MALANWRKKLWEAISDKAQKAQLENRYTTAEIIYDLAIAVAAHSYIEPCDMAQLQMLRGELFLLKQDYYKAEESFRSAVLLYDQNGSICTEVDMAIALNDMSVAFRAQGKCRLASQLSTLAQKYIANTRRKLEDCFKIPAA